MESRPMFPWEKTMLCCIWWGTHVGLSLTSYAPDPANAGVAGSTPDF